MSGIDWSLAPEGTTHYGPAKYSYVATWFKIDGDDQECMCLDERKCWRVYGEGIPLDRRSMLIERPKQPKAWSGSGLPPVGTVCEMTSNDGHNWRHVKIIFFDDYVVMIGEADGKVNRELLKRCDADVSFRPVRTPEQIAEDERNGFITELAGELSGHSDHIKTIDIDMAKYLWSKGYRKQATK